MNADQLPESRRNIVKLLKELGPSTIAQLALILALTGEAVRQQLLHLHRDGFVQTSSAGVNRTGRPATLYSLTPDGDHLFPKSYDVLNLAIVDAVAEELGPDALQRVLARVADARVAALEAKVRDLPLAERIAALRDWYLEDDPYMETDVDEFRLVERNCPFLNTAMRRPALCGVSVNALTRLLGVRVVRDEKFQNGNGRCVFRALVNEPIDPATWRFTTET